MVTHIFLDSNNPAEDRLFPHSQNLCKNTSVLGGTVLKKGFTGNFLKDILNEKGRGKFLC